MADQDLLFINNGFQTFEAKRISEGVCSAFMLDTYQFNQMLYPSGGFQHTKTTGKTEQPEPAFGVHIREAARGLHRLFNER